MDQPAANHTTQHNTTQHNTTQHNTTQRNTSHRNTTHPQAGKPEVMPQFERLFDNVAFKKGTEVDFSASGKGRLITKIDGKQVGRGAGRLVGLSNARHGGKERVGACLSAVFALPPSPCRSFRLEPDGAGSKRAHPTHRSPSQADATSFCPAPKPTCTHSARKQKTFLHTRKVGTIDSPELVKALFDIYLGKDPVSPDAKKSFGAGLASLLAE
jgi:hypothetical protein